MSSAATLLAVILPMLGCGPGETSVTFSEHIAPILQAKCQSCHRPGQVAPMSLLTYRDVRPFAELVRLAVNQGSMPPFYAAGPRDYFKDDLRLTDAEKKLIDDWNDAGAPEGDPAELPEPIAWSDDPWPLGKPDMIIDLPSHVPPPRGVDQFITLVSDEPFEDDLWVRALHLRPSRQDTVHHSSQFQWPPEMQVPKTFKTAQHASPDLNPLFTWLPGFQTHALPEGQAVRLMAGHRIASLTHFGPTRERQKTSLRVGLYLADGTVDSVQKRVNVYLTNIRIPPGEPNYELVGEDTFGEDGHITHFRVHMHLRGKATQFSLRYPDGRSDVVFDLPKYRFQWQRDYYLSEPLFVPKGTVAVFRGVWDNSADNPDNPDPTVWCNWGLRTQDEMFGAAMYYTPVEKLAEPIRIEKGRLVSGSSDAGSIL